MAVTKNGHRWIDVDGQVINSLPESEYEYFMHERRYTAIPKDDVYSVTKQDLIDHPEKFRPYVYSMASDFDISYKELAECGLNYFYYPDGRCTIKSNVDMHISFEDKDELVQDLVYMRENYQELYDELVTTSDISDIFSEVDKCISNKLSQAQPKHNSSSQQQLSGGKAKRHSVPMTITPDQVNRDELPEKITYVRKKLGNGFVFVPEDEQSSKAIIDLGPKNKQAGNEYTKSVTTEFNAMKNVIDEIKQNSSATNTTITTGGGGQTRAINNPMPNLEAKDIDLNDTFTRIDVENDNTGIIMRPDGTKYIVSNNQVQPSSPTPQIIAPAQVAPQTQLPVTTTPVEAFDPATDHQLISVIEKLQGAGTFSVTLNTECGVTRVLVRDINDKLINNLCFTVDLVGVCQTPDRKMWFGLPEIPDFAPSYAFNDAAINMIFTGEGEENLSPVFNGETCKLNRIVNLHSIFNIPNLDPATILSMMKVIKGIVNKRSVKIELEKKDNMNVRFTIGNFKDPKNFRLILQNRTYLYNGGPLSNNKNKSFYIEMQNNQMKLFTGKKSKQQQTPITQEQEDTYKRITAILNAQIMTKPSDIVNPGMSEEPDVIVEDLDPVPETVAV